MEINPTGNPLTEWLNGKGDHSPAKKDLNASAPAEFNRFPAGSGPQVMEGIKGTKANIPSGGPSGYPVINEPQSPSSQAPNTGPIDHMIMDKQVSDNTSAQVF